MGSLGPPHVGPAWLQSWRSPSPPLSSDHLLEPLTKHRDTLTYADQCTGKDTDGEPEEKAGRVRSEGPRRLCPHGAGVHHPPACERIHQPGAPKSLVQGLLRGSIS